jgi:hypothetical protein
MQEINQTADGDSTPSEPLAPANQEAAGHTDAAGAPGSGAIALPANAKGLAWLMLSNKWEHAKLVSRALGLMETARALSMALAVWRDDSRVGVNRFEGEVWAADGAASQLIAQWVGELFAPHRKGAAVEANPSEPMITGWQALSMGAEGLATALAEAKLTGRSLNWAAEFVGPQNLWAQWRDEAWQERFVLAARVDPGSGWPQDRDKRTTCAIVRLRAGQARAALAFAEARLAPAAFRAAFRLDEAPDAQVGRFDDWRSAIEKIAKAGIPLDAAALAGAAWACDPQSRAGHPEPIERTEEKWREKFETLEHVRGAAFTPKEKNFALALVCEHAGQSARRWLIALGARATDYAWRGAAEGLTASGSQKTLHNAAAGAFADLAAAGEAAPSEADGGVSDGSVRLPIAMRNALRAAIARGATAEDFKAAWQKGLSEEGAYEVGERAAKAAASERGSGFEEQRKERLASMLAVMGPEALDGMLMGAAMASDVEVAAWLIDAMGARAAGQEGAIAPLAAIFAEKRSPSPRIVDALIERDGWSRGAEIAAIALGSARGASADARRWADIANARQEAREIEAAVSSAQADPEVEKKGAESAPTRRL